MVAQPLGVSASSLSGAKGAEIKRPFFELPPLFLSSQELYLQAILGIYYIPYFVDPLELLTESLYYCYQFRVVF